MKTSKILLTAGILASLSLVPSVVLADGDEGWPPTITKSTTTITIETPPGTPPVPPPPPTPPSSPGQ